jgi:hypothetical protein
VYGLCRFNLQKFETMGIHLKGDLYWISFYPWFGLDRFHRTLYQNTFPFSVHLSIPNTQIDPNDIGINVHTYIYLFSSPYNIGTEKTYTTT